MSQPKSKLRVVAMASGRGTNLQALLDASARDESPFSVELVISDNPGAEALDRAAKAGVKTVVIQRKDYPSRKMFDQALARAATQAGGQLICLAGFMRVLSAEYLSCFRGRVINIHPSLLPSFPGLQAQRQALDYGVKVTGCTVHFVDEGVDTGPVIIQEPVEVMPGDTVDDLSARILAKEHMAYTRAVELIALGRMPFPHPKLSAGQESGK